MRPRVPCRAWQVPPSRAVALVATVERRFAALFLIGSGAVGPERFLGGPRDGSSGQAGQAEGTNWLDSVASLQPVAVWEYAAMVYVRPLVRPMTTPVVQVPQGKE